MPRNLRPRIQARRRRLSRHPDAMCSARDEPNLYGTADEHPADARRAGVDGALRVDVPLVDAADALQVDVGGLPQADGRRDARVDSVR